MFVLGCCVLSFDTKYYVGPLHFQGFHPSRGPLVNETRFSRGSKPEESEILGHERLRTRRDVQALPSGAPRGSLRTSRAPLHTYLYIYIYISCIEREMYVYIYIYIYIYIFIYLYLYLYVYVYIYMVNCNNHHTTSNNDDNNIEQ